MFVFEPDLQRPPQDHSKLLTPPLWLSRTQTFTRDGHPPPGSTLLFKDFSLSIPAIAAFSSFLMALHPQHFRREALGGTRHVVPVFFLCFSGGETLLLQKNLANQVFRYQSFPGGLMVKDKDCKSASDSSSPSRFM
ncbi:hypothetical protein L6164_010426 [Bauhinia variegata]|uniref:Uncharacterized protein n=1 Tax=Bauhinia variegata TaxID=167791 RepID=A0ACB9PMZ7_BAUVA|nr:hypothetical protein L6164_010426 [Bauhinia variegata]